METIAVRVEELVQQSATRARGQQAYSRLLQRLAQKSRRPLRVILDLSGARLVTGSFLDQLVIKTSQAFADEGIQFVFRFARKEGADKLARVCGLRGVRCRYQVGPLGQVRLTRKREEKRGEPSEYPGALFTT